MKRRCRGLKYARALNAKFLFLYNVNRFISYYVPTEENLYIDENELNELVKLEILEKFNTNKINTNNKAEIKSKSDLINIFKAANNKLREAGISIGISRFTEFSNLLFLKLISDLNKERNYNIPNNLLWDTYKCMDGDMLLGYINDTVIRGINQRFDSEIFTKLKITDTVKLREIIDKLETVDLVKIDTDIKGDAFEYFIQKYNQGNNDLGEYFTPRHILRRHIVETKKLIGIISLPCKVFMPYTEAKTSILIFRNNLSRDIDSVFFYKVKNDGYTLTTRRRPKSGINDLDEFINIHEEMLKSDYLDKVDSDNITYIKHKKITNDPNISLLLSHYIDEQKMGYIRLGEILERVKEKNSDGYETGQA